MKMIRRIAAILLLCICLTGCAEVINEEIYEKPVTVVDIYERGAWTQPIRSGKVTTIITHPAVHKVTISVDGYEYTISGSSYCDNFFEGEECIGVFLKRDYDNGKSKISLEDLKKGE